MKKLLVALALCCSASAQTSPPAPEPAGASWSRVTALPVGTKVFVKTTHGQSHCKVAAITEDSFACKGGGPSRDLVFARGEVRTVRIMRRGRSALILGGVGGGALAISAFAVTTSPSNWLFGPNFLRGPATAVGALGGFAIAAPIGAATNLAGSTVYRVP